MHCNCLVSHDLFLAAASKRIRLNLLIKMVDQTTHFPHILFHHWPASSLNNKFKKKRIPSDSFAYSQSHGKTYKFET